MMEWLIDQPSPFDPIEEWRAYLADLKTIQPATADILDLIDRAERRIAEMEAELEAEKVSQSPTA